MMRTDDLIWIETESFRNLGGWKIDSQAMDQVGSAYLLAHGYGVPVDDAHDTFEASPRRHRVWVRTRDWSAPAPGHPGRFQVLIDGSPLPVEFGTNGAKWAWQDGGIVELSEGCHTIALHDLTGFDGRADAIALCSELNRKLPDDGPALSRLRLQQVGEEIAELSADLVVAGGGVAGMCAALSAARRGLRVILLNDQLELGGNSSPQIRVSMNSDRSLPPYDRLGDVVAELEDNPTGEPDKVRPQQVEVFERSKAIREQLFAVEDRVELLQGYRIQSVERDGTRIASAIATDIRSNRRVRITAPYFVDATGDGALGSLAGASFRYGTEPFAETGEPDAPADASRQVLGATLHWFTEERGDGAARDFPECTWGLPVDRENFKYETRGAYNWECGFERDTVEDVEGIRDNLFRAIYGHWAYLRNHSPRKQEFRNRALKWMGYVLGKRESRRLMGDVVFSQHDIDAAPGGYIDECVACRWGIDLHYPVPEMKARLGKECYRAFPRHRNKNAHPTRWLPYRALYSRNVENLFVAGRCASMTHIAHGFFRNQRTTGMMGEVVGMAAAIAFNRECTPRQVYIRHWEELRASLKRGAGVEDQAAVSARQASAPS